MGELWRLDDCPVGRVGERVGRVGAGEKEVRRCRDRGCGDEEQRSRMENTKGLHLEYRRYWNHLLVFRQHEQTGQLFVLRKATGRTECGVVHPHMRLAMPGRMGFFACQSVNIAIARACLSMMQEEETHSAFPLSTYTASYNSNNIPFPKRSPHPFPLSIP